MLVFEHLFYFISRSCISALSSALNSDLGTTLSAPECRAALRRRGFICEPKANQGIWRVRGSDLAAGSHSAQGKALLRSSTTSLGVDSARSSIKS